MRHRVGTDEGADAGPFDEPTRIADQQRVRHRRHRPFARPRRAPRASLPRSCGRCWRRRRRWRHARPPAKDGAVPRRPRGRRGGACGTRPTGSLQHRRRRPATARTRHRDPASACRRRAWLCRSAARLKARRRPAPERPRAARGPVATGQARKQPAMTEVRVSQQHEVDRPEFMLISRPVAGRGFAPALEHSMIDEETGPAASTSRQEPVTSPAAPKNVSRTACCLSPGTKHSSAV